MLRAIITVVSALGMLLILGAYLTPRVVHVERSVTIHASADQIFPYLNDLRAANEWSPWANRDLDLVSEFSGPPSGVGATMSWSGNDAVGTGTQEITLSEPPNRLEVALDFGPDGTAIAFFDLNDHAEGTEVVWGFDTDMGMNPIGRYMGLMMDSWVGADYAEGLINLRDLVEDQVSVPRDPQGNPMEMPSEARDDNPSTDDMGKPEEDGVKPGGK